MQRNYRLAVLAFISVSFFGWQAIAATPSAEKDKAPTKKPADGAKEKPEDVLRKMADYLGKLPAFSCRLEAKLEVKQQDEEPVEQVTKMTARLERPNKLALITDEGKMGLTVVSDGKQLTQYLAVLGRYSVGEVPANYAEMTEVGVQLKGTILGSTGSLIPASGEELFKQLIAGATASEYIGTDKVNGVSCHHLRIAQKKFDWDIWIEDGKQPVPQKVSVDMSKQYAQEQATVKYIVTFSEWNVSPKFKENDFAFKPPADAQLVELLIEPDPPHPLLGKAAPTFATTDVNEHPFDLKQHLGKDVVMLEFWSTSCPACVMAMPELDKVAKKYADRGLVFRAVNGGEDAPTIKDFFTAAKFEAPVALDKEGEIHQAYAVEGIPQIVLIGKDGKVQVVHVGFGEELVGVISQQIEDLFAGKDLASAELNKNKKRGKTGG
jgi:peroxiredoxin